MFKGGLKVYTTLDTRLQTYAENAVARTAAAGIPRPPRLASTPATGYVKALVGGRNYQKSKFNLATQGKRQAGSSFKTFTLVTALQRGHAPLLQDRLVVACDHPDQAEAVGRLQQRGLGATD